MVDADDLLCSPAATIRAYCAEVGVAFDGSMLNWDSAENYARAKELFAKYATYHEDVLESKGLVAAEDGVSRPSLAESEKGWKDQFGEEGKKTLKECVNEAMADYEYLVRFKLQI